MPLSTWVITILVPVVAPLLPSPHDTNGWGLRIYQFDPRGPFLQCEALDHFPCGILLRNFSRETRETDQLLVAKRTNNLKLLITGPDGKGVQGDCLLGPPRDPSTVFLELKADQCDFERFSLGAFGHSVFLDTGRYRMQATMKIDKKTITSPPVEFEVVGIPDNDAVLVSHPLPLEGGQLKRPVERRHRVFIQQMKIGNRVWLVQREFWADLNGPGFVYRIIELPGKCEMKVEGAYGDHKPLTITYKDVNSPTGTTILKVRSSDGRPWTEEDEKELREREEPMPPAKP